jgi:DNA-binding XRE family transcriptional regulator
MAITTFNSLVKMESIMIININNYKKNNKKLKTRYSKWGPNELKEYRMSIGLTQKEMGFELGMSARMYQFYESGHTRVSMPIEYAMKHLSAVDYLNKNSMRW